MMSVHVRLLAGFATAGLVVGLAGPATAGTSWNSQQEVSSKLGRAIVLSDSGSVAAWIRTNRASGSGAVRTAYYKSAKKGWTPSAPIPGTSEVTNLQLSKDGSFAFAEMPGTGYVLSKRTSGNNWGTAATVVSGANLSFGQMSGDASTVAWVDWTGANDYPVEIPGTVKVMNRTSGVPVTVGAMSYDNSYDSVSPMVLSADGSTLVWLDETFALRSVTRLGDGSWSSPTVIKQYPSDPDLAYLALDASGSTVIWGSYYAEGVLVSQRSGTAWGPVAYVTSDEVSMAAISPNGKVVAYGNDDKQLVVRTWNGTKWAKPKVLGSSGSPVIALKNKTVAWTYSDYGGSSLRVSVYAKNKWQPATKRSSKAQSPALTAKGKTLAWGDTSQKRIYSTKR